MTEQEIRQLIHAQRRFFFTGETLPIRYRMEMLRRLKSLAF